MKKNNLLIGKPVLQNNKEIGKIVSEKDDKVNMIIKRDGKNPPLSLLINKHNINIPNNLLSVSMSCKKIKELKDYNKSVFKKKDLECKLGISLNKKDIPISLAKHVSKVSNYPCIVILGFSDTNNSFPQHVTTYGNTKANCLEAAKCGNWLKKKLGWPDKLCHSKPSKNILKNKTELLIRKNATRIEQAIKNSKWYSISRYTARKIAKYFIDVENFSEMTDTEIINFIEPYLDGKK